MVLIDFPMEGTKALGFVTKTIARQGDGRGTRRRLCSHHAQSHVRYLEIVPMSRVIHTDFSFDEAMSFIITGGTVGPDEIAFHGRPGAGERAATASRPRFRAAARARARVPGIPLVAPVASHDRTAFFGGRPRHRVRFSRPQFDSFEGAKGRR